jgi:predicted amidophosphoribosyltransferase
VRFSYGDGYMYCSSCGEHIPPLQALLAGFRCPKCGRKARGDPEDVVTSVAEYAETGRWRSRRAVRR